MKCRKCGEKIKDKFISVKQTGDYHHSVDFGANAEELISKSDKDYYHRECFNQRLTELNKK